MNHIQKQITEFTRISFGWFTPNDIGSITTDGGAYILLLQLEKPIKLNPPRKLHDQLLPGWYVYCGSAGQKGGIRSRLTHHFRSGKKQHWHIDQLTNKAVQMAALPVPNGNECKLLTSLLQMPGFSVAVKSFGNSDCRNCESHLLAAKMCLNN